MKNIILNKYYRKLRKNVFPDLEIEEFMEVFTKFKKLRFDYRLLTICNFLEVIKIPRIEIPIFRFLSMILDLVRWSIYDLLFMVINGKVFKPYGLTVFCGRQGGRKNYINGRIFR